MKVGQTLSLDFLPYVVEHVRGGRVVLKRTRRWLTRHKFEKVLKARRWLRPSVVATFLVDKRTGQQAGTYDLLALGVSSKRIEKLYATLPVMEKP